jgi:hypothetical protein
LPVLAKNLYFSVPIQALFKPPTTEEASGYSLEQCDPSVTHQNYPSQFIAKNGTPQALRPALFERRSDRFNKFRF